ncbi:hypothetical protein SAMN04487912_102328 [Arthrobacter sp. cf158]|uniref:hypothetical protein n=1 Tax=Arthrobacter sp. cf158 TaxID=1761744 RepID=UPI00089CD31E|nr:hypothetical protein [Arthrobacter sp. cf158]SDW32472.1 hypothetical protein SAMN04487912_102328 [Arthrobacter sp. cf158]
MSDLNVGDSFPVELLALSAEECTESTSHLGFQAFCVLGAGHAGRHIAADAHMIVRAAWG